MAWPQEWNQQLLASLTEFARQGLTASEIAAETGRTRNAVIGKIHRHKIPWNSQGGRLVAKRKRNRKPSPSRASPAVMDARLHEKIVRREVPPLPPPAPIIEPQIGTVTFADLAPHHCRWPFGDPRTPEFRYCGLTQIDGKPYCPAHARVAWERWRP
jgi:GcrA cell cycle regulator